MRGLTARIRWILVSTVLPLEVHVVPQPYPHGELVIVIDCADLDGNELCVLQPLGIPSA